MVAIIRDREFWTQGAYVASCGPWAADYDKTIIDYANVAIVGDGKAQFQSRFPDKPSSLGVYGYNYLAYGQYWQEIVEKPSAPLQLGKLSQFTFAFDYSMTRPDLANCLPEFFVRETPDKAAKLTAEIGFYLNMPPETRRWFEGGELVSSYKTPGGYVWEIRRRESGAAGHFYMIAPLDRKPRNSGALDFLAPLELLLGKPGVPATGWINGFAFGFEPLRGMGAEVINKFDVTLK